MCQQFIFNSSDNDKKQFKNTSFKKRSKLFTQGTNAPYLGGCLVDRGS